MIVKVTIIMELHEYDSEEGVTVTQRDTQGPERPGTSSITIDRIRGRLTQPAYVEVLPKDLQTNG